MKISERIELLIKHAEEMLPNYKDLPNIYQFARGQISGLKLALGIAQLVE